MKTSESSTLCKPCTKCGLSKPLDEFGRHAQGLHGRRSICRECTAACNRAYHQTPRGREVIQKGRERFEKSEAGRVWRREKAQRHRLMNPHKAKARVAVSVAIRLGHLIVPPACSACGRSDSGRIEAHHHCGYDEAHLLDVVWLCHPCHMHADGIASSPTDSLPESL